jgi:hypothetical protein
MPYHSMTDEKSRDEIWDDGLHFTEHGYSVMGNHIAKRLVDLVAESQVQTKLKAKDEEAMPEVMPEAMAKEA